MPVPGMFGEGGAGLWAGSGRGHWDPTARRLAVRLGTRSPYTSGMMLAASTGIAHTSRPSFTQLPFKKRIYLLSILS